MSETQPTECLLCRIVAGEIHADVVEATEHSVAIRDVDPKAPTHVLCIPRRHAETGAELAGAATEEFTDLVGLADRVAVNEGLTAYRLVINVGADAGQRMPHLYIHLLGGRHLAWPPG